MICHVCMQKARKSKQTVFGLCEMEGQIICLSLKKLACYQNLLFAYQVKTGDKSSSPITIWETKKNLMWQQKQPPFNSCSRWVPAQTELSCFRGYGICSFSLFMQVHRFFICFDATGKPHVCLAWSMCTTSNFKVYNSFFSHV